MIKLSRCLTCSVFRCPKRAVLIEACFTEGIPMSNPSSPPNTSPFQGFLPFFWLALACLGGILLADLVPIPAWAWFTGMAASILALVLAWRLPRRLVVTHHLRKWTRIEQRLPGVVLLAVLCLGGWRYAATRPVITPEKAANYNDRGIVQLVELRMRHFNYWYRWTNLTIVGFLIDSLITKSII